MKFTKEKIVREFKSITIIVVVVFAFRSVFFEPFRIPSGSMIPTLMIGDFILVNKFSYGFKVPYSDMFGDPVYITEAENPKRGDIIVFKYPKDPNINFIKRVIGLPGEKVAVRDKVVYINGEPLIAKEIDGKKIMEDMDEKFKFYNFKFLESKTGDHTHVAQINEDSMNYDFPETTIPPGHFFVMGDNRDFSLDSRKWGFVPHSHIKGRAILVWFSMIFPFGEDDFKFRPHRIGHMLE